MRSIYPFSDSLAHALRQYGGMTVHARLATFGDPKLSSLLAAVVAVVLFTLGRRTEGC
jgi:hypothetical protein